MLLAYGERPRTNQVFATEGHPGEGGKTAGLEFNIHITR